MSMKRSAFEKHRPPARLAGSDVELKFTPALKVVDLKINIRANGLAST
jgi:hypothetical protein